MRRGPWKMSAIGWAMPKVMCLPLPCEPSWRCFPSSWRKPQSREVVSLWVGWALKWGRGPGGRDSLLVCKSLVKDQESWSVFSGSGLFLDPQSPSWWVARPQADHLQSQSQDAPPHPILPFHFPPQRGKKWICQFTHFWKHQSQIITWLIWRRRQMRRGRGWQSPLHAGFAGLRWCAIFSSTLSEVAVVRLPAHS